MALPLRIELAGGLYRVMSRGNARRAIVRDDAERNALGGLLVGSPSFAMRIRRRLGNRQADRDVP